MNNYIKSFSLLLLLTSFSSNALERGRSVFGELINTTQQEVLSAAGLNFGKGDGIVLCKSDPTMKLHQALKVLTPMIANGQKGEEFLTDKVGSLLHKVVPSAVQNKVGGLYETLSSSSLNNSMTQLALSAAQSALIEYAFRSLAKNGWEHERGLDNHLNGSVKHIYLKNLIEHLGSAAVVAGGNRCGVDLQKFEGLIRAVTGSYANKDYNRFLKSNYSTIVNS